MHVCKIVYQISNSGMVYGETPGTCRITGEQSIGVLFQKWVKPTFNDYSFLKPGNIISNEALFCFDEKSDYLKIKTNRDKPQKFRTYSHIVYKNTWYCLTKANKEEIFNLICSGAEIVSLTETGQKHVYFKHKPGMWQLDDIYITPNIELFRGIHKAACDLLRLGFSQSEVITGKYKLHRIELAGVANWRKLENNIKSQRGTSLFTLVSWLLFISEGDKEIINTMYEKKKLEIKEAKKKARKEECLPPQLKGQIELWS